MGIRDKALDLKRRLSDRHMYSIVLVITAIIAGAGIYQYKRAVDFKDRLENQYHRSFNEMVQHVNNVEVDLAKGLVVTSPRQFVRLSSEIYRQSQSALAMLGQLPISHVQLENTARFLAQVGDFTYQMSLKNIEDRPITEEDRNQMKELSNFALSLNDSLGEMQGELFSGAMRFGELKKLGTQLGKNQTALASEMEEVEKQFQDYPALIYDGPFSSHLERQSAKMLEGGSEISAEDARERVRDLLGDRANEITLSGEGNGSVPSYSFAVKPDPADKNRLINVDITKVNGMIIWMLDNRGVSQADIDIEQAKEKAAAFLTEHNFENMKESYYEVKNNTATINYAATKDDIILYPDLVKVKVALDSGEITGLECKGYIANHTDSRAFPPPAITPDEALLKISPSLETEGVSIALIPLDSGGEALCYEIKGRLENKIFLVYINVQTGAEEDVLMLLETPDGTLTI